jgi:outer membrane protein assembly factor BamB
MDILQTHRSRLLTYLLGSIVTAGCSHAVTTNESQTGREGTAAAPAISEGLEARGGMSTSVQQTVASETRVRLSWPNWMGPRHDGISQETGWSTEWPESGLAEVWSREIGTGFSSITINNNRLFTMGHVEGDEVVYCLSANTGESIWSYSYPCELVDNLHDGGPGSTPTIDGEFIYTLGREGQLFCLRAENGEVAWKKELQDDLSVSMPEWGFTSSAYILGDQLILEAGRVVSYDKHSGAKNWQTAEHAAGYGSAISFERDGQILLATLDCDGLRITDSSDGQEIAFHSWDSPFLTNSTTPIVQDDVIYTSTGYQIGCGLFRLADDELELIYSNRHMRNHFNNSILLDGYLYGFDGNSNLGRIVQLTCMNFATGEVAWKQRGLGCGSLMVVDGKLLLLSEDGTLVLAEATPEGFVELSRSPFLEGRCWTVPLLLNGHVFGRNASGKLVCAKLPTGN